MLDYTSVGLVQSFLIRQSGYAAEFFRNLYPGFIYRRNEADESDSLHVHRSILNLAIQV